MIMIVAFAGGMVDWLAAFFLPVVAVFCLCCWAVKKYFDKNKELVNANKLVSRLIACSIPSLLTLAMHVFKVLESIKSEDFDSPNYALQGAHYAGVLAAAYGAALFFGVITLLIITRKKPRVFL